LSKEFLGCHDGGGWRTASAKPSVDFDPNHLTELGFCLSQRSDGILERGTPIPQRVDGCRARLCSFEVFQPRRGGRRKWVRRRGLLGVRGAAESEFRAPWVPCGMGFWFMRNESLII
jgi:hypothetical protein